MKIQKRSLFCIAIIVAVTPATITLADEQFIVQPTVFENPTYPTTAWFMEMQQPIQFTRSGVQDFLRHRFSRPEYAVDFLPHTFSHMLEFLQFGKDSHQNSLYILSTMRLFGNKVKMCSYVSATTLNNLLERLPTLLEAHLVKHPVSLATEARNAMKRIMYNMFLSKFSEFKENPDDFFGNLSGELLDGLNKTNYVQTAVDKEQLRQQVIRFLELCLNKAMWTPEDQQAIWVSVKTTSEHLNELMECSMISQEDLDDLYQSLVSRFIYFLDLVGSELSLETINDIKADLQENRLLMLTLEEQEEFIEPRAERLKQAVEKAEARIIARNNSDMVVK